MQRSWSPYHENIYLDIYIENIVMVHLHLKREKLLVTEIYCSFVCMRACMVHLCWMPMTCSHLLYTRQGVYSPRSYTVYTSTCMYIHITFLSIKTFTWHNINTSIHILHLFNKRGLGPTWRLRHVGTCEFLFQLLVEVNYVGEKGWLDFQFATHLLTVTKAS